MADDVLELDEIMAGYHISTACEKAVDMANETKCRVHFVFNDTHVTVQPGETPVEVAARWETDREAAYQAYISSPEYAERQVREAAEAKAKRKAVMVCDAKTEAEMREYKTPWPQTEKQLMEFIDSLVTRQHDYGTCVYAMSMAAEAAFNYVAHHLGATGFQSSCADMDFFRRTRLLNGPFMIVKGQDMLYPQYSILTKVRKSLTEWKPWAKEEAIKLLADGRDAHPDVVQHWEELANFEVPEPPTV